MRLLFIVLLGVFSFQTQAQEVKKVIKNHPSKSEKEVFHVLTSDKNTRHGSYVRINYDYGQNSVVETGFFKNNLKDSTWVEYYPGTKHFLKEGKYKNGQKEGLWLERAYDNNSIYLREKGMYKNSERVGPWQLFNRDGEVIKVYDYTLGKIYFEKPLPDSLEFEVLIDNNWEKRKLDQAPSLIPDKYGNDLINKSFANEIRYPMDAARAGVEGTVVIAFSVNEEGNASNFHVKTKLHPSIDAEALRVSQLMPRKFYPGMLNGKPVTTKMLIPVKFSIR